MARLLLGLSADEVQAAGEFKVMATQVVISDRERREQRNLLERVYGAAVAVAKGGSISTAWAPYLVPFMTAANVIREDATGRCVMVATEGEALIRLGRQYGFERIRINLGARQTYPPAEAGVSRIFSDLESGAVGEWSDGVGEGDLDELD